MGVSSPQDEDRGEGTLLVSLEGALCRILVTAAGRSPVPGESRCPTGARSI